MVDFKAQLGTADHPGLLDRKQRLARIERGRNPYVTGESLAPDSPVFFGRERELAETLAVLRRPEKPGSVSILGERRFGKSSFLNQIYGALAAEPDLVSIHAATQDWSDLCPERFFGGLHSTILRALDGSEHGLPRLLPEPSAKRKATDQVRDYSRLWNSRTGPFRDRYPADKLRVMDQKRSGRGCKPHPARKTGSHLSVVVMRK
ncbi:MAG: hypothetical protein LJE70_12765 [Chromatiaceae bacterium]|nr:hypothetical protein [Chromatiaceae bacterium]